MNDRQARRKDRMEAARRYFRQHHANVAPDTGFAGRVAARLTPEPAEILGWAALRLLPAMLALIFVLAWFAFHPSAATATESISPGTPVTEDPIAWVMEGGEGDEGGQDGEVGR